MGNYQEQDIYEYGMELAYEANRALSCEAKAVRLLGILEGMAVDGNEDHDFVIQTVEAIKDRASMDYVRYNNAVGALIGPDVFQEEVDDVEESAKSVMDKLSPEEKEWAEGVVSAMTTHFEAAFPDQESIFAPLIVVDEEGNESIVITSIADKGLDLGDPTETYDEKRIWANTLVDTRLTFELDGQEVDTRGNVNEAFLRELAKANPNINERIWRTGEAEKADAELMPLARLRSGAVALGGAFVGDDGFGVYVRPAVAKPRNTDFDDGESMEATTDVESVDTVNLLTPEQQERANKLTSAMAVKFGLEPEDFSVLVSETKTGEKQFTVAYTASNGIYKGSWNQIFAKKNAEDFMVDIDGQKVDTRIGMTLDVYEAMVEQARTDGKVLPDSPELIEEKRLPYTWTLQTGEKADGLFHAPAAYVDQSPVHTAWGGRRHEFPGFRFRPAVVI